MNKLITAARARIQLTATTPAQMEQLRDQVDDEVYSLVHNLYMSDAIKFDQIRVTQTQPATIVVIKFRPSSDGGQEDSGLNEDALNDLGYLVTKGRRNLNDFWTTLSAEGSSFTLTIGAKP